MKLQNSISNILILILFTFFFQHKSFAQCPLDTPYSLGDQAQTQSCGTDVFNANSNYLTVLSSCHFAGEYGSIVNASVGNTYCFGTEFFDYLTIYDADTTVLNTGTGQVCVLASTSTLYAQINVDSTCTSQSNCRDLWSICSDCPAPDGCTDPTAVNFDICAVNDNGSCIPVDPGNVCNDAVAITPNALGDNCSNNFVVDNFALNLSPNPVFCTSSSGLDVDKWFVWTATSLALYFESSSPGFPFVDIYTGSCDSLVFLDCAGSFDETTFSGWDIGDVLYIRVYDTFSGQQMGFCLEEDCLAPTASSNGTTCSMDGTSYNLEINFSDLGEFANWDIYYSYTSFDDPTTNLINSGVSVNNTGIITIPNLPSETTIYYYAVNGNCQKQLFVQSANCPCTSNPVGDCTGALVMPVQMDSCTTVSTASVFCQTGHEAWFKFTVPASGAAIISGVPATDEFGDTQIDYRVYSGPNCDSLSTYTFDPFAITNNPAEKEVIINDTSLAGQMLWIQAEDDQNSGQDSLKFCVYEPDCIEPTFFVYNDFYQDCSAGSVFINMEVTNLGFGNSSYDLFIDGVDTGLDIDSLFFGQSIPIPIPLDTTVNPPFASVLVELVGSDNSNCVASRVFNSSCPCIGDVANDFCFNADMLIVQTDSCSLPVFGDLSCASFDFPNSFPSDCSGYGYGPQLSQGGGPIGGSGQDLWYAFIVPASGSVEVTLNNNSDFCEVSPDIGLSILQGSCTDPEYYSEFPGYYVPPFLEIDCAITNAENPYNNYGTSTATITLNGLNPGDTLYIRVDANQNYYYGNEPIAGASQLGLGYYYGCPPLFDLCVVDPGGNDCPSTRIETGAIPSGTYSAGVSVTSDGQTPLGGDVNFYAGTEVILNAGFEGNADFEADIQPCGAANLFEQPIGNTTPKNQNISIKNK